MLLFEHTHTAAAVGGGPVVTNVGNCSLHIHTAEYIGTTGNATIIHSGRNGTGSWFPIYTFTFTAAVAGEKASVALAHAWEQYKTECTVLQAGASVKSSMAGA